jgi:hypothetical protein
MTTIAFHRSQFRTSPNGRHLITGAGAPFFWLADTATTLPRRLTRPETDFYLRTRAAQRFTVISIAALAGPDALTVPNAYGLLPFDGGIERPEEGFFAHLDYVVLRANAMGLALAIQPVQADLVGPGRPFTEATVGAYAAFLARRYRDQAVVWVLGGGDAAEDPASHSTWRALGRALKEHTQDRQLIGYLPGVGPTGGAAWCQAEDWLDFMMQRSGSGVAPQPWLGIDSGYGREPTKPLVDGAPGAEDQPSPQGEVDGRLSARQARMVAYWSVFAGACGHTYANHGVSSFHSEQHPAPGGARTRWEDALHDPGAEEMHYLRLLIESRPFQVRIPDQKLLADMPSDPAQHQQATRGDDADFAGECGSYAFIYTPAGAPVTVDLTRLTGSLVEASWFDPCTGRGIWLGQFPVRGRRIFTPPPGHDWVLVLDDSSRNYQPIGRGSDRSMSC